MEKKNHEKFALGCVCTPYIELNSSFRLKRRLLFPMLFLHSAQVLTVGSHIIGLEMEKPDHQLEVEDGLYMSNNSREKYVWGNLV